MKVSVKPSSWRGNRESRSIDENSKFKAPVIANIATIIPVIPIVIKRILIIKLKRVLFSFDIPLTPVILVLLNLKMLSLLISSEKLRKRSDF